MTSPNLSLLRILVLSTTAILPAQPPPPQITVPASVATGIALGAAANYKLTQDSVWKDYEDVVILSVIDELAKSAANSGQSLGASDYNTVIQQLQTLLNSNPPPNPTFPDEASCLRYAIDTLVNPHSGSSILSAPTSPLLPGVLANLENVKFTLLETYLSPSASRNYPAELALPSVSAGAYQFVQNYVGEVSDLAQANPQLGAAVSAVLTDLAGLDSTATYSQVQNLYPNALPNLPSPNSDGSYSVDEGYLTTQYTSIVGGVQSTIDAILQTLPSAPSRTNASTRNLYPRAPDSGRAFSTNGAANSSAGCTAGTLVISANQCVGTPSAAADAFTQAQSSITSLSKIVGHVDSQFGTQISTAGTAMIDGAKAVSQIDNLVGGGFSIGTLIGLATPVGTLLGAGAQIASLFGSTAAANPNAAVLAQISKLSSQITALQADVNQQFKQVDSTLNTILATVSTDYANLLNGQQGIQSTLLDEEAQINQLELYAQIWAQTVDYEALNGYLNACLDHRNQFPGTPDIGNALYQQCENELYSWATYNASDQLWAGVGVANYSDAAIYDTFLNNSISGVCSGCVSPFSTLVNYLAEFPSQDPSMGGLPPLPQPSTPLPLANPEMWRLVARGYLQLAREWPQYAVNVSSSRLGTVTSVGTGVQSAMHNANSLNGNPSTPNQALFSALVNNEYNGMATALKQAVANYESGFVTQAPPTGGACPPGNFSNCIPPYVNLWATPTSTSYVPPLVINGCDNNHPLSLALPTGIFYAVPSALLIADSTFHNQLSICITPSFTGSYPGEPDLVNLTMVIDISYSGVLVASMTLTAGQGAYWICTDCGLNVDAWWFLEGPSQEQAQGWQVPRCCDASGNVFTLQGEFEDQSLISLSVQPWVQSLYTTLMAEETSYYSSVSQQFACATAAEGVGIQQAGQNLSGAKSLLTAYVNFGLPTYLETDDVLRSLLYGTSSLLDCGATQAVYQAAAQAQPPQNPELDITASTGPPSSALAQSITNDLGLISQTQTPDSSYEIDTLLSDLQAFNALEAASGTSAPSTPSGALSFCHYQLSPSSVAMNVAGGNATTAVGVLVGGSNCNWTATTSASWLQVTSGQAGSNQGTVAFSVSPNASGSARAGVIIIGDQVVQILQTAVYSNANAAVLTSLPPGASITVAGSGCAPGSYTTPVNLSWSGESVCTISFTDPQMIGGAEYGFQSSTVNGSALSHTNPIIVNSTGATLLTNAVFNAIGGTSPATATHFSVSASPTATAGVPLAFTVTALDSSNNTVTTYSDPVQFTSTDPAAILPGDATLINGVNTFSASLVTAGVVTLTASDLLSPALNGTSGGIVLSKSTAGLGFVALAPCRVVDTRDTTKPAGFGPPSISSQTTRSFAIWNGPCAGIPASAQAYSLNVTVVPSVELGYLTVWPTGQSQPFVSTLNSLDGEIKANAAIVAAGTGGAISVFATDDAEVVLDINGYFVSNTTANALGFYPMTPCRLVDTRPGAPATIVSGALNGGTSTTLPILSSSCNVPATAQAYSLNFTLVPPGPVAYLTAYPTGESLPLVSTVNDPTGTVEANAAIAPAGTGGSIEAFVTQTTDLVVDINGYFAPVAEGALSLYALPPCRALDTRNPAGAPPFAGTINVNVIGSGCGGTNAAQAYIFNATVVPQSFLGFLSLWPEGSIQPLASTLNAYSGEVTSNMAIVPTSNTEISAFALDNAYLVLDLFGYFAP